MLRVLLRPIRAVDHYLRLPAPAKAERRKCHSVRNSPDPGIDRAIDEAVGWLARAQDCSASADGGVARHYSVIDGWASSYPETTGYIIPTLLTYAELRADESVRRRAKRMLDWLLSIQFPDGSFQGGLIDSEPKVPVAFNTGQILLGLVSGVREFGDEYHAAMIAAADWLVTAQDPDGCWRRHLTPFARTGSTTYYTHVAWPLFEAARHAPDRRYATAARANIAWALSLQHENGWFAHCCLDDCSQPLTHTIGYTLLGMVEAYRFGGEPCLLDACRKTADGLLQALSPDGFLPGRLNQRWRGTVRWACLTGSAQVALCWLRLYESTGDSRYWDGARTVTGYLRRTLDLNGSLEIVGAVKGSYPVDGGYCTYQYPNWATKFFIDANMLQKSLQESGARQRPA